MPDQRADRRRRGAPARQREGPRSSASRAAAIARSSTTARATAMPDDPVYRVRPRLHEPGPIATGYFLSARGIPVRRGEPLTVTGRYDAQIAHPAVMAITHVYVAPDESVPAGCEPLPSDRQHPLVATARAREGGAGADPAHRPGRQRGRPTEIARAAGPSVARAGTRDSSTSRSSLFGPPNLSIALGGTRHLALARRRAPRRVPRQRAARRRRAAHAPGRGLRAALRRARHATTSSATCTR